MMLKLIPSEAKRSDNGVEIIVRVEVTSMSVIGDRAPALAVRIPDCGHTKYRERESLRSVIFGNSRLRMLRRVPVLPVRTAGTH